MAGIVFCVDCIREGVTTARPTPFGGPRSPLCTTHNRARRKARNAAAHSRRVEKHFGITAEQYWTLYACQGGRCYGCGKATGATKKLAVDHDHVLALEHDHPVDQGCIECIRALLCGPCNQFIGRVDVAGLLRLVEVLTSAPARKFLAKP